MRIVKLFTVSTFIATFLLGETVYQQVRVFYTDAAELTQLAQIGIPLDHIYHRKGVFVEVVALREQVTKLEQLGMRYEILVEDLTAFYKSRLDPALRSAEGFELGSMGGNYTYDEMVAELDSLRLLYPALVSEKTSIGHSLEGRDIWAVKLSDNVDEDETTVGGGEPLVLYTGLTHAREPVSMMNLIYFMYYLCENYREDKLATDIVDNRELWFVPCVNPDGYVYNQSIEPNGGGMHRKNRRPVCAQNPGIDLNRNYGYAWGADNNGSSPDPCSSVFRGDSAFSEPETSVLRDFMRSKNFKNVLHYHTYSNLLIHSWGDGSYPPELDLSMLREYGAEMTKFNHYKVGTGPETVGYGVNGDAVDYSYGTLGLVSYTPEVGSRSDGFWPRTNRIMPLCKENVWPNLYFALIAGPILSVTNVERDKDYVEPGAEFTISFDIMNLGLSSTSGSVQAAALPLNSAAEFSQATLDLGAIDGRGTGETAFEISAVLSAAAVVGCPAGIVVSMDDSGIRTFTDTVSFSVGTPATSLLDDAESGMEKWNPSNWSLSSDAYEGDYSITDSPSGDYRDNAVLPLTLDDPVDLSQSSQSTVKFNAKWEIEEDYDMVQILASTDEMSWTPLWGKYSSGGSDMGVQPSGRPVYHGSQMQWVAESVDLSPFDGEPAVYLRFALRSDGYVRGDGFYFDNLQVVSFLPKKFSLGDVSQDCVINRADVTRVMEMILWPEMVNDEERRLADLNHDTNVDVFDLVKLVDIILGNE
ncbi:MAG: M14 family zinc carboxypeptidase [Candidatus Marinimicrobia bacterium]|jgi:hypothetical protein|nr:M14 family zinc carboxypeptidase [Candidatus Neomarinimicrobiota bacterium]MDP6593607.1 M14 family zinc carboxypeptidase [Candidatus Neomarinimicrobiota bacterium]MDP6836242.1 M14 family zinc carboxypeptidase [Candidatus Neomarinimicrobiota bacterium]|tara:strand:+ start:3024 stop:5288 length:2265 start_codon:yes stop_codon:yes gene_type:complete